MVLQSMETPMEDEKKRRRQNKLWANLDESARFVREQTEAARVAREAKSRRLKEMRLAKGPKSETNDPE
jgi:hypothetical protein